MDGNTKYIVEEDVPVLESCTLYLLPCLVRVTIVGSSLLLLCLWYVFQMLLTRVCVLRAFISLLHTCISKWTFYHTMHCTGGCQPPCCYHVFHHFSFHQATGSHHPYCRVPGQDASGSVRHRCGRGWSAAIVPGVYIGCCHLWQPGRWGRVMLIQMSFWRHSSLNNDLKKLKHSK